MRRSSQSSYEKVFLAIIPSYEKEAKAQDELRSRTNTLSSLLRVNLGLDSCRLTGDELVSEIQRAINPSASRNYEGNLVVDDNEFFQVEKIVVEGDRVLARNGSNSTIHRFIRIKEYPPDLNFDWLPRTLDTANQPYEITIEVKPLDIYKTVQTLDN